MRRFFILLTLVMTLIPLCGKDFRIYPGDYRLKSLSGTWDDGTPSTKYEFEYNETGQLIKSKTQYRPEDTPQMFEYRYGDDGSLKECIHYADKDLKNGLTTYSFSKERLLNRIEFNGNDLPIMMRFFTYDPANRITTETLVFNYAGTISQTLWLYEYGPKGAISSKTVYSGGLLESKETYRVNADGKGTTISISANDGQKKPASVITYLYDKKDRLIRKSVKYRDYDRCGSYTDAYTIDKNGNPETLTVTDYQGKTAATYHFEWEAGKSLLPADLFEEIIWNITRVGC